MQESEIVNMLNGWLIINDTRINVQLCEFSGVELKDTLHNIGLYFKIW
jgi:hypothetical protein